MAKKVLADGKKNYICKSIVFANSHFGIILKITSGFWSVLHIHVYFKCFLWPTLDFQIYVYVVPKKPTYTLCENIGGIFCFNR